MQFPYAAFDSVKLARKPCVRCGSTTVAWKESKGGKFYMIEAFDFGGEWRGHYRDFHSGYCKVPELHEIEQKAINEFLGVERETEEKISLRLEKEEESAAENAKMFLELHDLCKSSPIEAEKMLQVLYDLLVHYRRGTNAWNLCNAKIKFIEAVLK